KTNTLDAAERQMGAFSDLLGGHPELRRVLETPAIAASKKRANVEARLEKCTGIDGEILRLLRMLADRARPGLRPEIASGFGDRLARIHGVEGAMAGEMLEFPNQLFGIALNREEDSVGAVLLGRTTGVKEGDTVKRTGRIISVLVGEEMLGRVVDALGNPIDG